MNLGEMIDHVCAKVRKTDDTSKARCRQFLRQRHKMLWDGTLWRDSLAVLPFDLNLSGSGYDTLGILRLPPDVSRVIALGGKQGGVLPENLETFFRGGRPIFDRTADLPTPEAGDLYSFTPLGRVCWQGDEGVIFRAVCTAADEGTVIRVRSGSDGTRTNSATVPIILESAVTVSESGEEFNSGSVIESFTKPETTSYVDLKNSATGATLLRLNATETRAPQYPRIQLMGRPTGQERLWVLVKRQAPVFDDDYDESPLVDAENALLAFAEGDMLKRERQHAKANGAYTEGQGLVDQLKGMEKEQRAHRLRFIPDSGEVSGLEGYTSKGDF